MYVLGNIGILIVVLVPMNVGGGNKNAFKVKTSNYSGSDQFSQALVKSDCFIII